MSQISKLTPKQAARMAEFRDRWIAIGLCIEPADRKRAEVAIASSYRCAGLEPPKTIVWCGSPLSQGLTRAIILDGKLMRDIGASVWASVRDSVGDSVWDSVGASVRASVRASVGDSVWASVGDSVYGQHDAGWLAFYEYFRDVCELESQTEKLTGLTELAKSSGWALPYANICWVSERHHVLARDERGRLSCLTGPAVAYPDGWRIYAVHGVRVPEYVIERPQEIDVPKIDAEANAEIRRVMVERYGPQRFLKDGNAKKLCSDNFGTLYRRDLQGDEPLTMVHVVNTTPEPDGSHRDYFLRVPPEFGDGNHTARSAVAWTFGVAEREYNPLAQS